MVYSCKLIAIQECTDRGLGGSGARRRMKWGPIPGCRRRAAGGPPEGIGGTNQRIQTHRNPRGGQRDSQRSGRPVQTHRQHMIATERKPASPYSRLGSGAFRGRGTPGGTLGGTPPKTGVPRKSKYRDFGPPDRRSRAASGRDTKGDIYPLDEVVGGYVTRGARRRRRAVPTRLAVTLGLVYGVGHTPPLVGETLQPE